MSAPKRRPQQPQYQPQQQHYQQQYHQNLPPQQYVQDAQYSQYAGSPYQQQHLYYHPQQYPSADPYAAQASASTSPYPQHVQYQYQSQPYAPAPGLSYPNAAPTPYPQGGYLTATPDYNIAGDMSPAHLTPGSMSSGHSPRPSAGRARLNNFTFPSQGTSPSLESQVAHLNLTAPLPHKPAPYQATSRPASGMAQTANDPRSDISLRYPPLPSLPERCATPPLLRSGDPNDGEAAKSSAVDPAILEYVSSLRSILSAYEKRDDHLRLRAEAVGFQPREAWSAWQSASQPTTSSHDDAHTNPILGVRLLQRLDKLQRENDELERLLSSGASLNSSAASAGSKQLDQLRHEVQDSHRLIEAMDKALESAEARATAAERALDVACRSNSTAIVMPVKQDGAAVAPAAVGGEDKKSAAKGTFAAAKGGASAAQAAEAEDKKSTSKSTPAKKGSKPPKTSTAANSGKSGASQQQRTNTRSAGATKSTRTDKAPPPPPPAKAQTKSK